MLELKTKWFTNSLAKQSMLNKDFILCNNGARLFIISYGDLTSSGKNTYNYEVRDSNNNVIASGNDTYLDKLTNIIKGSNPKSKANKEASESAKKSKRVSNNLCEEYKRLEANLKKAILEFNDFKVANNITTLQDASEAQNKAQKARREEKQKARREDVAILKRIATLRKWSKETKRLDLLQSLNEKLLEM